MHNDLKRKLRSEVPEYPGLTWDESKQRYFPSSSFSSPHQTPPASSSVHRSRSKFKLTTSRNGLGKRTDMEDIGNHYISARDASISAKLNRMKIGPSYSARNALLQ